jgi:hypothetical protein
VLSDGTPVGKFGARGVRHTREGFVAGEFYHTSSSKRATELHRLGLPPQTDDKLMLVHHRLEVGHNAGSVTVNKVSLDIFIFENEGTWVEESRKATNVSCGHVVVVPGFENWHTCGNSPHGQDGCSSGDKGVTLHVRLRFSDVHNFVTKDAASDLDIRFASPSAERYGPRTFKFDTDAVPGNFLTPSNTYFHAGLWNAPSQNIIRGAEWSQISLPQWTFSPRRRHSRDTCVAPPSLSSHKCMLIKEPLLCGQTTGCKFASDCGCIPSACMCFDSCCISNVCSGLDAGRDSSKQPCEIFFASVRKESEDAEIMELRFPRISGMDSYMHSSLLWLGGDGDSDGDGIPDRLEGPGDSDGDGIANQLDLDSDNDGIPDRIEGTSDGDNDLIPNFLDCDSDGDGIPDAVEGLNSMGDLRDTDRDGTPDYLSLDADGDGIKDMIEGIDDADADGISNYRDLDSDGDGLLDSVEWKHSKADDDGDGKLNFLDDDSDGDGLLDSEEGVGDTDRDGKPNYLDTDSDDDGISDGVEGTSDQDLDGLKNYLDMDSDGDGILDCTEGISDFDGDGAPNFLDLDSDGDGIPDAQEGIADMDRDGRPNFLDLDSDGDSIPDSVEFGITKQIFSGLTEDYLADPDGDKLPNWWDIDSDGDGLMDSIEGHSEKNAQGVPLFLVSSDSTVSASSTRRTQTDMSRAGGGAGSEEADGACTSRCFESSNRARHGADVLDTDHDGKDLSMDTSECMYASIHGFTHA